jgi:membrane-bound lytic murein transglycosylase A
VARFHEIAEIKDSVVFFREEPRNGAIGTQDVVLTARRSLAVDRAVIPLSTPVWVDTTAPMSAGGKRGPFRQLLIAQDTGGNILGSVRGDIYWGDDRDAVAIGSRVNNRGQMWLLLPRSIRVPRK